MIASLERRATEIARWTLGTDEAAQGGQEQPARARVSGTASGLFVDEAPGSGH